jgi:hypothetical protein
MSPSSSGTSYTGGSSGAPEGSLDDIVEEYVNDGCKEGSRIFRFEVTPSASVVSGIDADVCLECCVACVAVLQLVVGRVIFFGLRLFAFLRPVVHHISRSSATELTTEFLELLELRIEGVSERDGVDRSRAFLSFRSPTFSTPPPSIHDRSAANMVEGHKSAGVGPQKTQNETDQQR